MTSGEGCYHIIQIFEHEGKLIETKLLILNSHTVPQVAKMAKINADDSFVCLE